MVMAVGSMLDLGIGEGGGVFGFDNMVLGNISADFDAVDVSFWYFFSTKFYFGPRFGTIFLEVDFFFQA
jgi:hypothetical protein